MVALAGRLRRRVPRHARGPRARRGRAALRPAAPRRSRSPTTSGSAAARSPRLDAVGAAALLAEARERSSVRAFVVEHDGDEVDAGGPRRRRGRAPRRRRRDRRGRVVVPQLQRRDGRRSRRAASRDCDVLIGGVDAAGTVAAPRRATGPWRATPSSPTAMASAPSHHGGFAPRLRCDAGWLTPLPTGLDARTAMVFGTAGYTAMASVLALESTGSRTTQRPGARHRRDRRRGVRRGRPARRPGLRGHRDDRQAEARPRSSHGLGASERGRSRRDSTTGPTACSAPRGSPARSTASAVTTLAKHPARAALGRGGRRQRARGRGASSRRPSTPSSRATWRSSASTRSTRRPRSAREVWERSPARSTTAVARVRWSTREIGLDGIADGLGELDAARARAASLVDPELASRRLRSPRRTARRTPCPRRTGSSSPTTLNGVAEPGG